MALVANARTGWALSAVSAGLVGFWLVLGGLGHVGHHGVRQFLETDYGNIVFALLFPMVGALILSRQPGNRLGALYCLCGLACSITLVAYSYAQRGLVLHPGSMPGALGAAWVSSWVWICGFSPLITFGVLGFPDGRLPSRRWWPVAALTAATVSVGVAALALRPGPLENHGSRDNPLGLPLPRAWFDMVLNKVWIWLLLLAVVASFAALIARYRRGSREQKDQYRWFLVAGGLLIVTFAIPAGLIGNLLVIVSVPLLPLSIVVAVLRSRVADTGPALRRSLVYGWLLAAGLALYAAIVVTLDALLRGHAQSAVALVGAGAVAVLYQPMRLRLQRHTDRLLYGDRGDPYAVLTGLGRSLEAVGSAEGALPATVTSIAQALRLPYVAIELPGDAPGSPTAEHGALQRGGDSVPLVSIPLKHGDDDVGRLIVGERDARETLTEAEHRLLDDLARPVAVATHAVLMDRALRRSRESLVLAREEERRRLRRDLHDGLGPALAGVALGVDAARNVLRTDGDAADELLQDLKNETLGCVVEVRRIVDDLRPPNLDELGLLPALTAFADRLSERDDGLRVIVESSGTLTKLPAAVEVAAYRIASEALTNVARHAAAEHCLLRLDVDGDLSLEVRDNGVGIPARRRAGVGLASMAERASELGGSCVVDRPSEGGTSVVAHLPLPVA